MVAAVSTGVHQASRVRFDQDVDFDPFDDTWHIDDNNIWQPEDEISEDPILLDRQVRQLPKFAPKLTPSRFTGFAFYMPADDGVGETGLGYSKFSFEGRRHMRRIYDTPERRILLKCARQVEKCLTLDSFVLMADGSQRRADTVLEGDRVASLLDPEGVGAHIGAGTVTWVSSVRRKGCYRITTRQGHVCTVAGTHPLRVWGGWLQAKGAEKGQRVAVVRRSGDFVTRAVCSDHRVALTAYMIGDGHTGSYLSFTSLPGVSLDDFLTRLAAIGCSARLEYGRSRAVTARVHVGLLHDWLQSDGLMGCLSKDKFVPTWVYQTTRAQTALFLNRLWSTDGHVKRNSRSRYSIEYCSMSRRLVRDVQTLLWKFGIPSKIRKNWPSYHKKKGVKKFAYILRVETKEGVRVFLEEIGALGKSDQVDLPEADTNNNRDTYAPGIELLINRIIDSRGSDQRFGKHAEHSLRSAGLREHLEYAPTKGKLQRYVDFFRADLRYDQQLVEELAQHLTTDLYWDTVKSVEYLGFRKCVDFTVEGTHNFVADGFITHNSTYLGNRAICYMSLVSAFKVLYVSPSATQTTTFSNDRVKDPIETSPLLKRFTTTMLSSNILEKQFVNRSKITMRYAFLNADRARGIPAYALFIDEFQDVLSDNIPVIEQCLSHAPEQWKQYVYAGTPKSLDNNIETYWAAHSTQNEWVVPHDCKSGEGGRFWNVLGEKNIGKRGLICENCGTLINPMHPEAQWARMVMQAPFEGYRIPQLMVPWKSWDEILLDYKRYPRDKFYNEVLGISYDSGLRPLTRGQVRDCCNPDIRMGDIEKYRAMAYGQPVFAGIDWGCHDEDTRILTRDGFKYFRNLTDDDEVAQWESDTRRMTFVKPKVRTVRDWDQPLLHFKTKGGVDMMVTHTHRMRVGVSQGERWLTESAGELAGRGGNAKFVGHVEWDGDTVETFTLPGLPKSPGYSGCEPKTFLMRDWLEFFGYVVTEGGVCLKKNASGEEAPYCIKMSQRETVNPQHYQKIQDCLVRLGVPHSAFPNPKTGDVNWVIYGKQFWKWFAENMGIHAENKRIPREFFLTAGKRGLRILFDAMVLGDGYVDPRDDCTGGAYYSTSRGLCEGFQEICIRLGLRCIVRLHKPAEGNRKARWRALWSAGRDYTFNTPSTRVKQVPYKGKVYCCAVPSGYIVTERNGCISYQGNTGEHSYTVISLGIYIDSVFRIFFIHRFEGEDVDPPRQLARIDELIKYFNVKVIGADYGGGYDRNDHLVRQFGPKRLQKFQYMANFNKKVAYDPKLGRWKLARTEVMSDVFNAIKRMQRGYRVIEFPNWDEFNEPYAQDCLNIFSEYNKILRKIQYRHSQDKPDDSFHSILYCWLGSMCLIPRPDIIAPVQEIDGVQQRGYRGPLDQG